MLNGSFNVILGAGHWTDQTPLSNLGHKLKKYVRKNDLLSCAALKIFNFVLKASKEIVM